MNKICLKSISVISFPKIIFEIEHYECKSQMMYANDGDLRNKTSIFVHFLGAGPGASDIK